jgi:ADP-heptose:LPS heptosyltransferase
MTLLSPGRHSAGDAGPCPARTELPGDRRTVCVASLAEAERALQDGSGPLTAMAWRGLANTALSMLRAALFERTGYDRRDFRSVVVYTVGILGDNVVMLPALAAIRRAYPEADITLLVNTQTWDVGGAAQLLDGLPWFDRWMRVNDSLLRRCGTRFVLDRGQVGDLRTDLFINLSPFGNRAWLGAVVRELALANRLGATHAVGFRVSGPHRALPSMLRNEPRRAAEVLALLGLKPDRDCLPLTSAAARLPGFGASARVAVIHPGAKFAIKQWPAERFGEVATALAARGFCPVVTGTAMERVTAEAVCNSSGGVARNLAGETTVASLAELLRRSALCVTNDTGTMHLAALLDVPTVALFAMRNTPRHWFPNARRVRVLFSPVMCRYCLLDDNCPDEKLCLTNIAVPDVLNAVESVLKES